MELQVDRHRNWKEHTSDEDAFFSRPRLVGFFSVLGDDGTCTMDDTLLRYWNPRFSPVPHTYTNERIQLSPQSDFKIPMKSMKRSINMHNYMLKYAAKYKGNFDLIFDKQPMKDITKAPIMTHQGLLRSIASLPYNDHYPYGQRPVKMMSCLHRGVIHIIRIYTDEKTKDSRGWGGNFCKRMLQDKPNAHPDASDLDHWGAYVNIYRSTLGEHSVLYSAEMDGVKVEDQLENISELPHEDQLSILDKSKFVEIKIKASPANAFKQTTFQKCTTLDYYVHSLFGRNDFLVCGFHDRNHMIMKSKLYDQALLISESNGYWKKEACLNFCNDFFNFVKQSLKEEINKLDVQTDDIKKLPIINIVFEYCPSTKVIKVSESQLKDVNIIPEWLDGFMDETD